MLLRLVPSTHFCPQCLGQQEQSTESAGIQVPRQEAACRVRGPVAGEAPMWEREQSDCHMHSGHQSAMNSSLVKVHHFLKGVRGKPCRKNNWGYLELLNDWCQSQKILQQVRPSANIPLKQVRVWEHHP